MKKFLTGINIVFKRNDSRMIIVLGSLVIFFLVLLVQNGGAAREALGFTALPFMKRVSLGIETLFDIYNTFNTSTLMLAVVGSVIGALNLSLAYTYMKLRGEVILKSGLYSGIGLFLAFLGIGCAACGTVFVSILLSFFGLSSALQALPYHGEEIGYLGLFVLILATYTVARKVGAPNVC